MEKEFPIIAMQPAEQRRAIRERIVRLEQWLAFNDGSIDTEQAHLREGSRERVYWHYGYLTALRDVLKLLEGAHAH